MTDKELLELAAKAAGVLTSEWYGNGAYFDEVLKEWNPLTDDGDALQLAVKLNLVLRCYDYGTIVDGWGVDVKEELNNDPYAATRRAIVRSAAEIGKEMK